MISRMVAAVVFVQDLPACTAFYRDVLSFQLQESDENGSTFFAGGQYVILLTLAEAGRLLQMQPDALITDGKPRGLLAAQVDDVDAMYADLQAKGVTLLRPPTDQAWGLRTAHFADPEGNVWEIHQSIMRGA